VLRRRAVRRNILGKHEWFRGRLAGIRLAPANVLKGSKPENQTETLPPAGKGSAVCQFSRNHSRAALPQWDALVRPRFQRASVLLEQIMYMIPILCYAFILISVQEPPCAREPTAPARGSRREQASLPNFLLDPPQAFDRQWQRAISMPCPGVGKTKEAGGRPVAKVEGGGPPSAAGDRPASIDALRADERRRLRRRIGARENRMVECGRRSPVTPNLGVWLARARDRPTPGPDSSKPDQVKPSRTKPDQGIGLGYSWIPLDFFVRFVTFQ
jgi:hypothetical protein